MPPPTQITGFDPRFFRPCIFPVLGRFGYGTRVTLNNGVGQESELATPMTVSFSAFDESGSLSGTIDRVTELSPGQITKLNIDELLERRIGAPLDRNLLCVFHVVPSSLVGIATEDVRVAELMAHIGASDDFIEFHQRPAGVVTGVAYQTGPMNDARLSSTRTTVVQAPKVIVSEPVDTLFALMNISTSFDYDNPVQIDFWVLGPEGDQVARSSMEVPGWSYRLVSVTEVLEEAGRLEEFRARGGVGMFLGYAKNGSLVPLSLTRNKVTNAIACDHTLPPPYYVSTWGGEARLRGNERLEQTLFRAPEVPEPVKAARA
jgi:hypothetical protein